MKSNKYEILDYREYLKQRLAEKKEKNPYFSLRAHEKSDLIKYQELFKDSYEVNYFNNPKLIVPVPLDDAEEIFEVKDHNKEIDFAIESLSSNEYLGYAYIYNIDSKNRTCYFEIVIGQKYWEEPFEEDAAERVVDFIFNELNMRKILLSILSYDNRSLSIYKKIAFSEECVFKKHFFRNGKYYDNIIMTRFQNE